MADAKDGILYRSARDDSGPSIIVTTKAEATGSRSGRAKLSATTRRITNIPIVADWAAVRQNRATSVTGCGSLTASEKFDWRAPREVPGFSTRRCPALLIPVSMAKITGEVPFGCPPPVHKAFGQLAPQKARL